MSHLCVDRNTYFEKHLHNVGVAVVELLNRKRPELSASSRWGASTNPSM
jgi:hypothetical protein